MCEKNKEVSQEIYIMQLVLTHIVHINKAHTKYVHLLYDRVSQKLCCWVCVWTLPLVCPTLRSANLFIEIWLPETACKCRREDYQSEADT